MGKKRKSNVNKTQAIKEALERSPRSGPTDIAKKLNSQGIAVTPTYVSTIKSNLKKRARKGRLSSRPRTPSKRNGAAPAGYIAVSALEQAQRLIEQAGGVAEARKVLDIIARLK